MLLINNYEVCGLWAVAVVWAPLGSAELVEWPGVLASGFLVYARCIPWQQMLITVAAAVENSVAYICGSGTRAPRKCRLQGLMGPFLCPALYPT